MTDDDPVFDPVDRECMTRAIAAAARVRCVTSPNPWVGCVIRSVDGENYENLQFKLNEPLQVRLNSGKVIHYP